MATLRTAVILLSFIAALPACILVERVEFTPYEEEEPIVPPPPPTPSIPQPRLPMNNSYQGSVHTGSLRPLFRWEASQWNGPETIRYEFQLSRDSSFSSETTDVQTTATNYQPVENLAVSLRDKPVGARYFWRVRACADSACSPYSRSWWVNLGRTPHDLNGDGFADMVVSTFRIGTNRPAGNLYIYAGRRSSDFNVGHNRALIGNDDVWFGTNAAIGDFNGDGLADIASRVTKRDSTNPRIHIYLGNKDTFISSTPDHIFANITDCTSAGDLNGDAFDDLIIPSGLVYGTSSTPEVIPIESHGLSHPIGDVNGDGLSDFLFQVSNGANVYFGMTQKPMLFIPAGELVGGTTSFAGSASSAGDINGDGFGDFLVSDLGDQTGGSGAGRAYVFLGGPGSSLDEEADGIFTGAAGDLLGLGVHALGDLNNDGFADIGIRLLNPSPQETAKGGIRIRFGKAGRFIEDSFETQLLGIDNIHIFGRGLAAGDMNGDGFSDLMVGAPGFSGPGGNPRSIGQAYIFLGNLGRSLEPYPDGTITGPVAESSFGDMAMDSTRDRIF